MSISLSATATYISGSDDLTIDDDIAGSFVLRREEKALEVLEKSQNPIEIILVLKLIPFKDVEKPFEILSKRLPAILDATLECLYAKKNDDAVHYVCDNNRDKANEIQRRIAPDTLCSPIWNSEWISSIATSSSCATRIADAIDSETSLALHKLPFKEWVKTACYRPSLVIPLYDGLLRMCRELRRRSVELCQPMDEYEQVKEKLRRRNSLAYQAVCWHPEDPLTQLEAFDKILDPIRDLIARPDLEFMPMLKHLHILEVLYEEDYNLENFALPGFSFLNSRPMELVKLITNRDTDCLRQILPGDFTSFSATRLNDLSSRWLRLAAYVKACFIADNGLAGPISKVVEELLLLRNYYSAMALIYGLGSTRYYSKLPTSWKDLINPDDGYAVYRNQISSSPALPFLFPHIQEIREVNRKGNAMESRRIMAMLISQFVFYNADMLRTEGQRQINSAWVGFWVWIPWDGISRRLDKWNHVDMEGLAMGGVGGKSAEG